MGFEFHLRQPPCDVAFLSVVNGSVLYNAEGTANGSVKEATIRRIGWHVLDLPAEWFFSDKAHALMDQVCRTMQCTIQYLGYQRLRSEEAFAKNVEMLDEVRAERDALFKELTELRNSVAPMELRHGYARTSRHNVTSAQANECSDRPPGSSFVCALCGNAYPSISSLESHTVKRHRRTQRYAAVAGAGAMAEEIASLRGDVSTIRRALADRDQQPQQQRREPQWGGGEAMSSPFLSSTGVIAVPAPQRSSPCAGAMQESVETLQAELRDTRARLAQLESAIRQQFTGTKAVETGPLEPSLRGRDPNASLYAVVNGHNVTRSETKQPVSAMVRNQGEANNTMCCSATIPSVLARPRVPRAEGKVHGEKPVSARDSPASHTRLEREPMSATNASSEVSKEYFQKGTVSPSFANDTVVVTPWVAPLGRVLAVPSRGNPTPSPRGPGPNRVPAFVSSPPSFSSLSKEEIGAYSATRPVTHADGKGLSRCEVKQEERAERCNMQRDTQSQKALVYPYERNVNRTIQEDIASNNPIHDKPEDRNAEAKKKWPFVFSLFKKKKEK